MKKFSLALLALAMALAITPAAFADAYNFSFTTDPLGYSGNGTLTTGPDNVVYYLTGTLNLGSTNLGSMTLDPVGSFASNDNIFTSPFPWFDQNGLSFNVAGIDYNLFYFATTNNYIVSGCGLGTDCISFNAYGDPSTTVEFSATQLTPEPGSLFLLGTGLLGVAVVLFRKARPSNLVLNT